jgi:hypothetical protein
MNGPHRNADLAINLLYFPRSDYLISSR